MTDFESGESDVSRSSDRPVHVSGQGRNREQEEVRDVVVPGDPLNQRSRSPHLGREMGQA
ncbi:hypothetical protein K443DRAFT_680577 [Laccaria amethystina LaAM-08-1]|uniref:Uncharacterized protein n=1 Tax=Laccaria amethystina LaAM-08-1 TaxID=1095629 RepID=A0A0C9XM95_9AGAR|nr:hypothetical protein K443DRAFT_680577 [Laccaria amethystina LaAM-08-1]